MKPTDTTFHPTAQVDRVPRIYDVKGECLERELAGGFELWGRNRHHNWCSIRKANQVYSTWHPGMCDTRRIWIERFLAEAN